MILKNQVLERDLNKPIVWDAYFNSNQQPKPLVIFCHGYKGFKDWGAWDLVAQYFMEQGCFFVKFNFSHNGGTVNEPIDFPDLEAFGENNYSKELNDLDDMINMLLANEFTWKNDINALEVTLIGHSRGGGISIIKASEDNRVTSLITWASVSGFGRRTATTDVERWKKDGVKYVLNGRTKQMMPHFYQFHLDYMANQKRFDIETATKNLKIPFLIIHAKGDPTVKFNEAEELHSFNNKCVLYAIEESNHVFDARHPWDVSKMPIALLNVADRSIDFIKSTPFS